RVIVGQLIEVDGGDSRLDVGPEEIHELRIEASRGAQSFALLLVVNRYFFGQHPLPDHSGHFRSPWCAVALTGLIVVTVGGIIKTCSFIGPRRQSTFGKEGTWSSATAGARGKKRCWAA